MRKVAHLPQIDETSDRALVAAEIRGYLAKKKIPTYKLSEHLKSDQSRGYWQRRVSGEIALDIDDLAKLAALLEVPIARFFNYDTPQPNGGSPARSGSGDAHGRVYFLPVGPTGIEPMTSTVESHHLALVTQIDSKRPISSKLIS